MIPQSFIQDLLNRVDIIDVIERHVPLKKAGTNYSACCPFHSEKTPSFTVSPTKQFYHCFGCGAHGSAVGFMMEYGGLNFIEAVNDLADRVGIQVPTQQSEPHPGVSESTERRTGSSSQNLFEVMSVATRFYRDQLKHSESAVTYLKKRGLTGETASRFAIGYAPAGWQNLAEVFSDYQIRTPIDPQVETGLVVEKDAGKR